MLNSSHCFNHVLSDLYWRWIWLRISTENKSKIDMKHLSWRRNEQVLQMTISNAEKISDCAISRTRKDIILHYFRGFLLHKLLQIFFKLCFLECPGLRDEFDKPIAFAAGECLVRGELIVLIDSFQQSIHKIEHFKDHLVLSEVIPTFEEETEASVTSSRESKLHWSHCRWEDSAIFNDGLLEHNWDIDRIANTTQAYPINLSQSLPKFSLLILDFLHSLCNSFQDLEHSYLLTDHLKNFCIILLDVCLKGSKKSLIKSNVFLSLFRCLWLFYRCRWLALSS